MRMRRLTAVLVVAGVAAASLVSTTTAQTAPVANADTATVLEDQSVTINVLANDTPAGVTIQSVGTPSRGTAIVSSGAIVYTPKSNFHGTDSFTYTITNGTATASATVTVTVTPVNDAPVAKPDKATTKPETAIVIDILANDKDVDGDALSVVLVTQPANGTAVLNSTTQKVTYTPAAGFTGTDTFTYYATDGQMSSNVVTLTVQVKDKTKPVEGREAKILAACEAYSGPTNGVHSLCRLYIGNDLPAWARANLGQIILRHTGSAAVEGVAEVCARVNNSAQVERLCDAYESGWLPPGLQKKVAQMIVTAGVSSQATVGTSQLSSADAEAEKKKPGKKPMGTWKSPSSHNHR